MIEPRKPIRYFQINARKTEEIQGNTIVETPVSLTVNGEVWTTFMCTPIYLEALMVGFLFNEGVIDSMDEVEDVRICEHGDNVDVWLTHNAPKPDSWTRTSGCTGGVTAVASIQKPEPVTSPKKGSSWDEFSLSPDQINHLVEMLFESQELYRETGGVHTSTLSDGDQVILSAEDIGRHNTLDKIAGLCLMENIWPDKRILITTGRISSEMLQKGVRMGAKVIASRTSPSSLSIELAEAWGITLIGYARRNRFNLYAAPERILLKTSQPS
jgi:FdhD protein